MLATLFSQKEQRHVFAAEAIHLLMADYLLGTAVHRILRVNRLGGQPAADMGSNAMKAIKKGRSGGVTIGAD
jgi:hypothetical protein